MTFPMKRTTLSLLTVATLGATLIACSKNESSASNGGGNGRLEVYLTDAPGDFDSVFVDVQDVRVNYSSDSAGGWQSLGSVRRGAYNLLELTNDRDTLLGSADLQAGRIQQLRLVLGSNNYVVVDGQRHALETPSAQQSGLKLNIHQEVREGITYQLLLDFDAGRSIHRTGNGRYMLNPVIRTSLRAAGGSLRGFVHPDTVQTRVLVLNGTDTVAGTYTVNGAWAIRSVQPGTYQLQFVPQRGNLASQSRTGVVVIQNQVTTVDTVRFQ